MKILKPLRDIAQQNGQRARLKAFTLVEMLVVMILSVIVVGIAYLVYVEMHRFTLEFQLKTERSAEILTLDQQLRHDARYADDIVASSEGFSIHLPHPDTWILYEKTAAGLRRTHGMVAEIYNIDYNSYRIELDGGEKHLDIFTGIEAPSQDTLTYTISLPASARKL